ncbi:hypothetical protein IPZ60_08750 [Psychrobacter sp. NG25]|uniref:hypothetical protein n=1 Tax=Psychrobacter sp. NG25 TaxID=2782005 RepID=UPI001883F050|nr:hypothetical protein [Psychrobacter sp. NG25]MBF0658822.1 hypothetical protein [Psychrobacter sp. NG25]
MKSNTFKCSLLAVGIAAALGISSTANADPAQSGSTTTSVDITNQASATYKVSNEAQPEVKSNTVKITVSEQVSFSLSADNDDTAVGGTQFDASNVNAEVSPDGFVLFRHTLKNTGNRTDTYAITTPTAPPNYNTADSTVSYKIYNADGVEDTTRTVNDAAYGASSGKVFPLEKGHYISFVIKAKTTGNKGGTTQALPISAVSTLLTASKTLNNTNTSFTKLPTFNIVKTITNALDLNDSNDTATYQVVVTNDGNTTFSTDATDIAIEDLLPPGLVMATKLASTNIKVSGNATRGTIATGNEGSSGFKITGVNIPVGQNVTITFDVKKGGAGTLVPATAINHVTVTDDLDNNPSTANTLIDSTDIGKEQNVSNFYTGTQNNFINGQTPVNPGDDSTLPLLTIKRTLTLTNPTIKEIAPTSGTSGQVTHQTVITNTGKDIEGSKAGELTFTITDNDGNTPDAINIVPASVTIVYDPKDGTGAQSPKTITAVNGVYDIFTALPGGIATNGTVTINYNVSSLNASLFTPLNSTDSTFENTIVTLIPKLEGAPAQITVTDTTTVRGLTLLKTQAIDANCDGTNVGTFVTTEITGASPGQCIIYKIQAKNTSTTGLGFNITDVVISDELAKFSANADYVSGSAKATASAGGTYTASNNGTAITTTVATLAPQGTATMEFKVKIKTNS